jgi:hypothetical protein
MLFMVRIGDGFEIVFIPRDSADILRRSPPFSGDASGILQFGVGHNDRLQKQLMMPAISEVI